MFSLLIGVGGLFLAVIVSAIINPLPRPSAKEADRHVPTMDAITLSS